MSQRARTQCWLHVDGVAATVSSIEAVLSANINAILDPESLYGSDNMQSGIDMEALRQQAPLLQGLLELDPRGGYLAQTHVNQALTQAVVSANKWEKVESKTVPGMADGDVIQVLAYKIRVMLSHTRNAYDNSSLHEVHALADLFSRIRPQTGTPDAKRQRRDGRLVGKRPHPFINFRATADEPEQVSIEEEEVPRRVSCYYDAATRKGIMLMSDGSERLADHYMKGSRGFAECVWYEPTWRHETEVPNPFVNKGEIIAELSGDVRKDPCSKLLDLFVAFALFDFVMVFDAQDSRHMRTTFENAPLRRWLRRCRRLLLALTMTRRPLALTMTRPPLRACRSTEAM